MQLLYPDLFKAHSMYPTDQVVTMEMFVQFRVAPASGYPYTMTLDFCGESH